MNHNELIAALTSRSQHSPEEVKLLLDKTVGVMRAELTHGNTIHLQGFGSLEVKRKEERLLVHPATKQRTLIPPKQVVHFKQSLAFKSKLNETESNE